MCERIPADSGLDLSPRRVRPHVDHSGEDSARQATDAGTSPQDFLQILVRPLRLIAPWIVSRTCRMRGLHRPALGAWSVRRKTLAVVTARGGNILEQAAMVGPTTRIKGSRSERASGMPSGITGRACSLRRTPGTEPGPVSQHGCTRMSSARGVASNSGTSMWRPPRKAVRSSTAE